ncbi:hypothetical protein ACFSKL_11575 [Belliella marina]|uniref:Uncharacterized protein n=1 Tax=Belliella marina TaxID=1644146 RepID=A0ABW4VMU1_9BACT
METSRNKVQSDRFIGIHPNIEKVKSFFWERKVPLEEAELFFYYHESMGWRTDSGASILDWKPFAKQWIGNLGY